MNFLALLNRLKPALLFAAAFVLMAAMTAESPASMPKTMKRPHRTLRLFLPGAEKKTYLRGYHWLKLSAVQKRYSVELARQGAMRMKVIMTLPAEMYLERLDRMFALESSTLNIEVGQAIQGIAIALHDWDDGRSPLTVKEEYVGKEAVSPK